MDRAETILIKLWSSLIFTKPNQEKDGTVIIPTSNCNQCFHKDCQEISYSVYVVQNPHLT